MEEPAPRAGLRQLDVEKAIPAPTTWQRSPPGAPGREESGYMKYMLLIYNNMSVYENLPEDERKAIFAEVDEIMTELRESGELVGGMALADPSLTRTVRVRDGVATTTDGPFAEAKEQFAGNLIVDCETPERAVEIAARWPDARYFAMEVRPVMHDSGADL
jgi:hypothetical protein